MIDLGWKEEKKGREGKRGEEKRGGGRGRGEKK